MQPATGRTAHVAHERENDVTREQATELAERIVDKLDAMARDIDPYEYGLPSRYGDERPEFVLAVVEILTRPSQ